MRIPGPRLTKVAARLVVALVRCLFWTCRVKVLPENVVWTLGYTDPSPREYFLYSIWHDLLIFPIFGKKAQRMATLVSRHQDGSYLTELMRLLGIASIRGSSNRGGARAVRELMKTARHYHISITPDGPRGPRRQVKPGIVYLASRTGRAIIPTAYSCTRCWSIRGSWTDLKLPMPFGTVFLLGGDPIYVPPDLSREQLAQYTQLVQQQMDRLDDLAQRLARGERVEPGLIAGRTVPASAADLPHRNSAA